MTNQFPATDISADVPTWAAALDAITFDDGATRDGTYGYECHQLLRNSVPAGWVYDLGVGYVWLDASQSDPEPYTTAERGES